MKALDSRLMDALSECARYNDTGRTYWWRKASMHKLEALGLVVRWTPPSVAERKRMTIRPWRVTAAGRAALRQHPSITGETRT